MRKLILFIVMLVVAGTVNANHIKGGWIYYKYLGPGSGTNLKYEITIKLYRDCNPPTPGQNDDVISVTVYSGTSSNLYTTSRAPLTNTYSFAKTFFGNCITNPPKVCYVILEYKTTIELPPNPVGYTLAFQRCCRILGITNVEPPTNDLGITYTCSIPGTQNGANFPQNNSAQFSEKDTVTVCYDSHFELDYSAKDPDGDSLTYSFCPALGSVRMSDPSPVVSAPPPYDQVSYLSAFSYNNPLGTNISINPQTGLISGMAPVKTGEYVIAVCATEYRNNKAVTVTRKELHIAVAACGLTAAELEPEYINCRSDSMTFVNNSTAPNIYSYFWDFGVSGTDSDTSILPTPTYVYKDTGQYTVKLIINKNGQCTDSTTATVKVYPGFKAGFDYFGSCIANPVQFTDTTQSKYGKINYWLWNFGDSTNLSYSNSQNPSYHYNRPGNLNVSLIVGNDLGCRDTVTAPIVLFDKQPIKLPFRDTLICSIDSLQILAEGTGDFSWSPAYNIINSDSSKPVVFPKNSTTYYVTLTNDGCANTDSVRVNVIDRLTVSLPQDTTVCMGDDVMLNPVSVGLAYTWTPVVGNTHVKNIIVSPVVNTTYQVLASVGSCIANASINVKVAPYPRVNAGADTLICHDTYARLEASTVASSFEWKPDKTLLQPNILNPVVKPYKTTEYILTVRDTLGCPKPVSDTVVVRVIPPVKAYAGNDTDIVFGQTLQLNASGGIRYAWTPAALLSDYTLSNPLFKPEMYSDSVLFMVRVFAEGGCYADDSVLVRIFKTGADVLVPTAFTPNGDGKNDILKPILVGIKSLTYFRIYNRWGEMVFHTNESGKGWDGAIDGKGQPSGTYVYVTEAVDYTDKLIRKTGTIVLIK